MEPLSLKARLRIFSLTWTSQDEEMRGSWWELTTSMAFACNYGVPLVFDHQVDKVR